MVQALEENLKSLWEILQSNNIRPPANLAPGTLPEHVDLSLLEDTQEAQRRHQALSAEHIGENSTPVSPIESPIMASAVALRDERHQAVSMSGHAPEIHQEEPTISETAIAGAVCRDGGIEVHGVASIMYRSPSAVHNAHEDATPNQSRWDRIRQQQCIQARLVSNAALQRQREAQIYRSPCLAIDFDGVSPEVAKHLLDLHWNRQHLAYLISYRPAIMDSLFNGGPYCNQILLNAIYYSMSLFSDRSELWDSTDRQCDASPFYRRFKALLGEAMFSPSIPSAVALLLCGATLVSHGQSSVGWILCGTAYRMVTDLGCHLVIDRQKRSNKAENVELLTDLEREIRLRLYWGAFLTDATQSLYLGRSPWLQESEARAPPCFKDSYEELEDWQPYMDPQARPCDTVVPAYAAHPAYAISTFKAMVSLFRIAAKMMRALYSLESIKTPFEQLRTDCEALQADLEEWLSAIPSHLKFDPDIDRTPPPHQVTPQSVVHIPFQLLPISQCLVRAFIPFLSSSTGPLPLEDIWRSIRTLSTSAVQKVYACRLPSLYNS